jgi:hypothetical protein
MQAVAKGNSPPAVWRVGGEGSSAGRGSSCWLRRVSQLQRGTSGSSSRPAPAGPPECGTAPRLSCALDPGSRRGGSSQRLWRTGRRTGRLGARVAAAKPPTRFGSSLPLDTGTDVQTQHPGGRALDPHDRSSLARRALPDVGGPYATPGATGWAPESGSCRTPLCSPAQRRTPITAESALAP